MNSTKKRVAKDYDKLPEDVLREVKLAYPTGFVNHLISFTNAEGKRVSALPFETAEVYYLIRMTATEAEEIIENDDDYDDDGNLVDDFDDGGDDYDDSRDPEDD